MQVDNNNKRKIPTTYRTIRPWKWDSM